MTCRSAKWALQAALVMGASGCARPEVTTTIFTAEQQVPSVNSPGSGMVSALMEGDILNVYGTFTNLAPFIPGAGGPSAHVQEAPRGENGPIVFDLTVVTTDLRNGSFSGSKALTEAELQAFRAGRFYANIHSSRYPDGELRAQLEPQR